MNEEQESAAQLRLLEDILYNRINQKKQEMHKATERAVTDKLWTEVETLQWVLGQSLYVRRKMEPNEVRYYY
jgi:hypothetical protein